MASKHDLTPRLPWHYRVTWRIRPVPAPAFQESPQGFSRYASKRRRMIVWAPRSVLVRNYKRRTKRETA